MSKNDNLGNEQSQDSAKSKVIVGDFNQSIDSQDVLISDLLDDHVTDETIEQLLNSEEQQERWFRYNLVRSVIQSEYSSNCNTDFAQTLSAKIAEEPAIIAKPLSKNVKSGEIIPLWKRVGGGISIAASVAFAMVFSVQLLTTDSTSVDQIDIVDAEPRVSVPAVNPDEFFNPEQAKLDEIQAYLRRINHRGLNVNEELVSDVIFKSSFVVNGFNPPNQVFKNNQPKYQLNKITEDPNK